MLSHTLSRILPAALLLITFSCSVDKIGNGGKPYIRYWWFASEIKKEDVRYNLDWLKDNGFGGVEIAWVYPLNAMDKTLDTAYTPRQGWLGPEWQEIVRFTIEYADSIGLACDLTLGTLWPFGDSRITYEQASQVFGMEERQMITKSWEYPGKGYVVDHLNPDHYLLYFQRLLDSFPQPQTRLTKSYFIDSWEVETKGLWTDGIGSEFKEKYGYDITAFMDSIYEDDYGDQRYDYMKLISGKVIRFYQDFDSVLNARGLRSRGQCSGAPCDILSAYGRLDIPEGEAMLYEPEFSSIPASSALLSGKGMVSAETFTCLYGWPRDYIREEQTADLKLVADALFANGINLIIWHGKPHNPEGQDSVSFYASVHVGKDGNLAPEMPAFNEYLGKVSSFMQKGITYSDVAVYLPVEDAWIKGVMPADKQFIWAWGYYEMRYLYFPEELKGYRPTWINREFLQKGIVRDNKLLVGDACFDALYVDASHMDYVALRRITELAEKGLIVIMKRTPREAGSIKHEDWSLLIERLQGLSNVSDKLTPDLQPLVEGETIPAFWAREDRDTLYIFFANPLSQHLHFPLEYGQSFTERPSRHKITVNYRNEKFELDLVFEPYQSLLFCFYPGAVKQIGIAFQPTSPVIKQRPLDYHAPWLVK